MKRVIAGITGLMSCLLFGLEPGVAASDGAPQLHEELRTVPTAPYDESADAHAQVAAAIASAAAGHKFVLLEFGGNWCPDCRVTAGVLAMGEVKPWVERTFEMVPVDVGRMRRNLDIAAQYRGENHGCSNRHHPRLAGQDDQHRNPAALQNARGMSPQAIVDTIYGWISKTCVGLVCHHGEGLILTTFHSNLA